jgi:hypothetical protein
MGQVYNVCIKLNETWKLTVQIFGPDGVTPLDLTGRTARVQVRQNAAAAVALLDLTEGSGLTFTAASALVEISSGTSAITSPGTYVWALEIGGAENFEYVSGRFTVEQDIVRTP